MEEVVYKDVEIVREDVEGRLITVVDKTDFPAHYEYLYLSTEEARQGINGPKTPEPFHKMALKLVIYKPRDNEEKGSWRQYLDIKSFLFLCQQAFTVYPPPAEESKWGIPIFNSVGFSSKKNIGSMLDVSVMWSSKKAGMRTYQLSFKSGPAKMKEEGTGFSWEGTPALHKVMLQEEQMLRMLLESKDHIEARRIAALTHLHKQI